MALIRKSAIFDSDQVYQCALGGVVVWLQEEAIKISWSGRKCCCNSSLLQQLWRTFKDEDVYLHACNGWMAEISLAGFLPPRVGDFRGRDFSNTGIDLSSSAAVEAERALAA